MRLDGDAAEGHGPGGEPLDDVGRGLNLRFKIFLQLCKLLKGIRDLPNTLVPRFVVPSSWREMLNAS